jgi:hypothetical protein
MILYIKINILNKTMSNLVQNINNNNNLNMKD